ncbi:unnamed protein product [Amoebophrya sp. A120]|nr:unnamed protein product [Amoebophrya sp. A120]|eukprot:GSA120T00001356001.1
MASSDGGARRACSNASIGHYILGKTIGEGTFGKVKLGTHILTGEKVAVKILEKERIVDVADVERVAREIHILKLIRHPHIIQLYEIIETPKQLYLIMEFASGGELFDYIVAQCRVKEREAVKFFHQILNGVEKIHSMRVVHRDLKPENLLLDSHKNIKIVDFGLSNTYKPGQLLKTACGSPCYAAPEMIAGKKYAPMMCDIWSCGVILFALVCGYLPFEDQNTAALYKKILGADYQTPKFISQSVNDLISGMLTTDPAKRMTAAQIKQHPWYRGLFGTTADMATRPSDLHFLTGRGCEVPDCSYCLQADSKDGSIVIEEDILSALDRYGFPREYAVKCLEMNKHNHVTTTYYLLARRKFRAIQSEDDLQPLQELQDTTSGGQLPPGSSARNNPNIQEGIPIYNINPNPQANKVVPALKIGTSAATTSTRPPDFSPWDQFSFPPPSARGPPGGVPAAAALGGVVPPPMSARGPGPNGGQHHQGRQHYEQYSANNNGASRGPPGGPIAGVAPGSSTTSSTHHAASGNKYSTRPSSQDPRSKVVQQPGGTSTTGGYVTPRQPGAVSSRGPRPGSSSGVNGASPVVLKPNYAPTTRPVSSSGGRGGTYSARGASAGAGGGVGGREHPGRINTSRGVSANGPRIGTTAAGGGGNINKSGTAGHPPGASPSPAAGGGGGGPTSSSFASGSQTARGTSAGGGPSMDHRMVGSGVTNIRPSTRIATPANVSVVQPSLGVPLQPSGWRPTSQVRVPLSARTHAEHPVRTGVSQPPLSARGYGRPVAYSNCDVVQTSTKSARQIAQELQRALTQQRVMFKLGHTGVNNGTVIKCQKQYVKFDLEISGGLEGVDSHMVKFRRTGGDLTQYKEICHYGSVRIESDKIEIICDA